MLTSIFSLGRVPVQRDAGLWSSLMAWAATDATGAASQIMPTQLIPCFSPAYRVCGRGLCMLIQLSQKLLSWCPASAMCQASPTRSGFLSNWNRECSDATIVGPVVCIRQMLMDCTRLLWKLIDPRANVHQLTHPEGRLPSDLMQALSCNTD